MITITVGTSARSAVVDLTSRLAQEVAASGVREGICTVFVPHTTAGVTINEHDDPDVVIDMLAHLDAAVAWDGAYRHSEGNSAAHIKASLMGSSVQIPISDGKLRLGTWQGVFFCEFDGPRQRHVWVTIQGLA